MQGSFGRVDGCEPHVRDALAVSSRRLLVVLLVGFYDLHAHHGSEVREVPLEVLRGDRGIQGRDAEQRRRLGAGVQLKGRGSAAANGQVSDRECLLHGELAPHEVVVASQHLVGGLPVVEGHVAEPARLARLRVGHHHGFLHRPELGEVDDEVDSGRRLVQPADEDARGLHLLHGPWLRELLLLRCDVRRQVVCVPLEVTHGHREPDVALLEDRAPLLAALLRLEVQDEAARPVVLGVVEEMRVPRDGRLPVVAKDTLDLCFELHWR
mmetsp:Transcript_15628/g.31684  ORF Transcript_15628/g.31684 Transcript_15628/m.31684 type:complete len:267 (-) Transcript_15628:1078-1878(-)